MNIETKINYAKDKTELCVCNNTFKTTKYKEIKELNKEKQ